MNMSDDVEVMLDDSVTFIKVFSAIVDLPFLIFHVAFIVFMFKMRAKKKSEYLKSFMTILLITAVLDTISFLIVSIALFK